ncbi:MAG: TonB-dependent receptor [Sphingomonadaceae bacterium]|nr:TonB-dependent receptor [Sphingomonadaceae bacterium]
MIISRAIYIAMLAATTSLIPANALAQANGGAQNAQNDDAGLAEIVVTARRREESLQDTPIAVTAFDQDAIEARAASDIRGVVNLAPNVNLQAGGNAAGGNNTQIFIRGVGQDDFLPTADPGVGVYVDGVYLGRSVGGLLKSGDLAQIEVLRGPQGTLFGRNTIGGAINIRTVQPSLDGLSGSLEGTLGEDGLYGWNGAVNVPLSAKAAFRFSGGYRNRNAYGRSLADGSRFGNEDYGFARAAFLVEPSDETRITVSGDWYKQVQAGIPVTTTGIACANGTVGICPNIPGTPLPAASPTSLISLYNAFIGGPTGRPFTNASLGTLSNPFVTTATGPGVDNAEIWGIAATIEHDFSDSVTFKSITAYRKLDAAFGSDADGASARIAETLDIFNQKQFSQELQLNFDTDRLDGTVGLYYFRETGRDQNTVLITPGLFDALSASPVNLPANPAGPLAPVPCALQAFTPIPGTPFRAPPPGYGFGCVGNIANVGVDNELFVDQTIRVNNYAAFGQATYKFTDALSMTFGLRLTREVKRFSYFQQRLSVSRALGVPFYAVAPSNADKSFTNLSPRIGLEYKFSPDVLGYAAWSRGFKSGTFNGRATSTQGVAPVDPETVDQFEGGLKTEFADRRVRLNLAGFYSRYTDLQLQSVVSDPALGLLINLVNAGKARIYGAELEMLARPVPALEIGFSGGYTNSRITAIDPAVAASTGVRVGNSLKKSPKWNFNASAQYEFDLGGSGQLTPRIEYAWVGKQYHDAANNPDTIEGSYGLLNGRIAYSNEDIGLTFAVYGNNLADTVHFNSLFRTGGGQTVVYPARGREIGVSAKIAF